MMASQAYAGPLTCTQIIPLSLAPGPADSIAPWTAETIWSHLSPYGGDQTSSDVPPTAVGMKPIWELIPMLIRFLAVHE